MCSLPKKKKEKENLLLNCVYVIPAAIQELYYTHYAKKCSHIHHRASYGVRWRVYRFQLVQHFAYNNDTCPHSAHAGGQGAIVAVRQRKGPGRQKDII